MLVSHSHRIVFVHVQKTGGITVSKVLRQSIPDISPFKQKHAFAVQAMEELDNWDEYFKFAFVRNPWDRLVSWYSMIKNADTMFQLNHTPTDKLENRRLRLVRKNKLWRYVLNNGSTFEEFIKNCIGELESMGRISYSLTSNQLDYLVDCNNNLLVDFIGRFENFQDDLLEVSNRIGIELKSIPHSNRSPHRHYSSFYTPETEMIVRVRFQKDIEYFGYEFEDIDRSA